MENRSGECAAVLVCVLVCVRALQPRGLVSYRPSHWPIKTTQLWIHLQLEHANTLTCVHIIFVEDWEKETRIAERHKREASVQFWKVRWTRNLPHIAADQYLPSFSVCPYTFFFSCRNAKMWQHWLFATTRRSIATSQSIKSTQALTSKLICSDS